MFIFRLKEADWGWMAFAAHFPSGSQNSTARLSACAMHSVLRKQHPCPSNTRRGLRQFLVIYHCLDKRGGGDGQCSAYATWVNDINGQPEPATD